MEATDTAALALRPRSRNRRDILGTAWRWIRPDKPQRTFREVLKDAPKDWSLERCAIPANVLQIALIATSVIPGGPALGQAMRVNYLASRVPPLVNLARAMRWLQLTLWTRPQAQQGDSLGGGLRPPIEMEPTTRGVPQWMKRFIRTAEDGPLPLRVPAAFFDDWINERARHPGFLISMALVGAGTFIMPLPALILFPLNMVIGFVPRANSAWLWFRNGRTADFRLRFNRHGMFQRRRTIELMRRRAVKRAMKAARKQGVRPVVGPVFGRPNPAGRHPNELQPAAQRAIAAVRLRSRLRQVPAAGLPVAPVRARQPSQQMGRRGARACGERALG